MKFDDKQIKAGRMRAVEAIDPAVLAEPVNPNFPEGKRKLRN